MVSVNSNSATSWGGPRGSPSERQGPSRQQNRSRTISSNRKSSYENAFYFFAVLLIFISIDIIYHSPIESLSQFDTDLKRMSQVPNATQEYSHGKAKSLSNFRKVSKPGVVEDDGGDNGSDDTETDQESKGAENSEFGKVSNKKDDEGSPDSPNAEDDEDSGGNKDKGSADARDSGDDKGSGDKKDIESADVRNSGDDKGSGDKEDKGSADDRNSGDNNVSGDKENKGSADDRNSGDEKGSGDKKEDERSEDMYFRDPNAPVTDWHYYPPLKHEIRRDPSWTQAEQLNSAMKNLNKEECDRFMANVDTSPPPLREPSNRACEGYDGVFQIYQYDWGGASGACFFLFTVGMLAWADQHNYLPWIHIDNDITKPIWDPIVHLNRTETTEFSMLEGMDIGWYRDPDDPHWHMFPGKPFKKHKLRPKIHSLDGTGVWEHYFLPVNDFAPGDSSCQNKPLLKMSDDHIVPGMHSNAPWAPRAWRYTDPDYLTRWDLPWNEWYRPQRKRGAQMTERYIRFNPMMEKRAHCSFPNSEFSLGMHIRHSDKVVERRAIGLDEFFPYAEAFVNNKGGFIYIATDSTKVVESIFEKWPKRITDHVIYQPSVLGRSTNDTATFNMGVSHHRTNVEALTDVLALSKSSFLVHGQSAMSEAAMYLNPELVSRSFDLEQDEGRDAGGDVRKFMIDVKKYRRAWEEKKKREN